MRKCLGVCVLVLLVLASAVGLRNLTAGQQLVAGGGMPMPPDCAPNCHPLMAGGGLPMPPTKPLMAGGGLPMPPTKPLMATDGLPMPPGPVSNR